MEKKLINFGDPITAAYHPRGVSKRINMYITKHLRSRGLARVNTIFLALPPARIGR